MLPLEKQVKTVAMLIQRTQSNVMRWVDENVGRGSNNLVPSQNALARLARGVIQDDGNVYISEASGIKFRLKPPIGVSAIAQLAGAVGRGGVSLELIDKNTGKVMETLYESDGLPMLASLYRIVDGARSEFDNKLNDFLGE